MARNWLGQEVPGPGERGGIQPIYGPSFPWRLGGQTPMKQNSVAQKYGNLQGNDIMQNFANDWQWGGSDIPIWQTYQHGLDEANLANALAQDSGGGLVDRLGGLGNIVGLGAQLWGLKQKGDEISNLEKYRSQMGQRANAALAMDREKMGMIRDERDILKLARKADIWSQRPGDPNANPFTNQLVSQEV